MAIIKKNLLAGAAGPLIFKVVKGKQIVATKAARGTVKQSKGTIQKAKTFGLASRFGSEILQSFKQNSNCFQDLTMFNRITKKLYSAFIYAWNPETQQFNFDADNFSTLAGFDYNSNSPLHDSLGIKTKLTFADGLLHVTFSECGNMPVIKFLKGSTNCIIMVGITLFRLQDGVKTARVISQCQVVKKYADRLEANEFKFKVPGGCLCVTSIFLNFYTNHRTHISMLNSKGFSPAAICDASFTPDSFAPENDYTWTGMRDLKLEMGL